MSHVTSIRMLDTESADNEFIEVIADGPRRGYFKRISKDQAVLDDTTIRVTQEDKRFEVRIFGVGWRSISQERFETFLEQLNQLRESRSWPIISVPSSDPTATLQ